MEKPTVSLPPVCIYYAGFSRAGIAFLCLGWPWYFLQKQIIFHRPSQWQVYVCGSVVPLSLWKGSNSYDVKTREVSTHTGRNRSGEVGLACQTCGREKMRLCKMRNPCHAGAVVLAAWHSEGLCLLPLAGQRGKACPPSPSLAAAACSLPRSPGSSQLSQGWLTPRGAQASCALVLAQGHPEPGAAFLALAWLLLSSFCARRGGVCLVVDWFIFFFSFFSIFIEGCRLCNRTHATWSRSACFRRTAYGCGDGEVPN